MKEIKLTRDLFLWCMSVIYLSAFSSLYHQIPGLYGDNGILPARSVIPLEADANVLRTKAKEVPTLIWLAPALGIDVPLMMDVLALLGIILSFGCMVCGRMRDMVNYGLLWMLYFSLYQVGQTFMYFQWDILLLEVGFLTIVVAPLGFLQNVSKTGPFSSLPHRPHDTVSLWLIRWLLFRFMFSSGVVKLTSMCPAWWGLTALDVHFESQCIPTQLAWYAHHLPEWMLRLGVVSTFVIEIPVPFLFFIPIRSLRIFSCYAQVFFQVLIILTGNFNFFNLLTLTLCISLVDDEFLLSLIRRPASSIKSTASTGLRYTKLIVTTIIEAVVICGLVYWTIYFFSLKINPDWSVSSKIAFSPAEFKQALTDIMPVSIVIGVLSLAANIILAFYKSVNQMGALRKVWSLFSTFLVSCVAIWLFLISLVPHAAVDITTQRSLWPVVREWYKSVDPYQITNAYGLFRRMTGTDGGRPELIVEGSNSVNSGWKEYHFIHKPGDLSVRPHFLIPHQPRLDWQMWFAALSSYQHNPWFVSFVYRLLEGKKEVLKLLDKQRLPFPANKPPKYIRATLYKYNYTPFRFSKPFKDWWTRRRVVEYFNTSKFEKKQIVDFLTAAGIPMEKTRYLQVENLFVERILKKIRSYSDAVAATTFIWSLLFTGLCCNFLVPVLGFR